MAGCRPLEASEIQAVLCAFQGRNVLRNRALFILGCNTGFRISELLTICIGDVWQRGRLVDRITISKRFIKGKTASRTIPLNQIAKSTLEPYVRYLLDSGLNSQTPLFHAQYQGLHRMTRIQAWRVLQEAFATADLQGSLGTHTMRKSFAKVMYQALGYRIEKLQKLLGHKWITSTISYISDIEEGLEQAVLDNGVGLV